jgi:hypothetical protein
MIEFDIVKFIHKVRKGIIKICSECDGDLTTKDKVKIYDNGNILTKTKLFITIGICKKCKSEYEYCPIVVPNWFTLNKYRQEICKQ